MEDFGQIFIILIFIAVSVLEGVGRKRKAGQQGKPRPGPTRAQGPRRPAPPMEVARRTGAPPEVERGVPEKSSEGLVPEAVWEEILGLARGTPMERPVPPPAPAAPPVPLPPEPRQSRAEREESQRQAETLEVIPEFEARSLEAPAPRAVKPVARPLGRAAAAATGAPRPRSPGLRGDLFGSGSPEELRKAIILKEVLGPPLALRD